MTIINPNSGDYAHLVQKAVTRNTAIEVIDAKQSGNPINKEDIQASNQAIKDKSLDIGLAVYQNQQQRTTVDTYVQISQDAKDFYASSSDDSNSGQSEPSETVTFDAQTVNEVRSTAQKRAAGIAVYENIQANHSD